MTNSGQGLGAYVSNRFLMLAIVVAVVSVSVPVQAGEDDLLAAGSRLAANMGVEQSGELTHVHRRSRFRTLGGALLATTGAWLALSYYGEKPGKQCGLVGHESNTKIYGRRANSAIHFPERYEFSPIMADGECMLQGVVHDGDYELWFEGELIVAAQPYTLVFSSPVKSYQYQSFPAGHKYVRWYWSKGDGVVEATTSYGEIPKTRLYGGIALIGAGLLLATYWSDAPAPLQDIQVFVTPDGGFSASRTIGW